MYYKIDGVMMPLNITQFSWKPTNIYSEATGSDEAGINHLDLIRPNVRSWEVQHEMITRAERDKILDALNPLGFDLEGEAQDGRVHAHCYGTVQSNVCTSYYDDTPNGSFWTFTIRYIEN